MDGPAWAGRRGRAGAVGTAYDRRVQKTLVLNVVGLTPALLRPDAPNLSRLAAAGSVAAVGAVVPGVTCSVQSTYLTGTLPQDHGVVGNGWYDRDAAEVKFWRQSNGLVAGPKLWDDLRAIDPAATTANLFWWFAMYSSADLTVTPRPMYPADGRKLPDVWTRPAGLRDGLQSRLGRFPLFKFWGPAASIESTRWIASAALDVMHRDDPTLTLTYLPHLDYPLQKFGPDAPEIAAELRAVDAECGRLIDAARASGRCVFALSEYGVAPVDRPVHLNRVLRNAGLLVVRDEVGRDYLDAGASEAFAVADHQVAHVYVNGDGPNAPPPGAVRRVRDLIATTPGVGRAYAGPERAEIGLDHPRAGDVVALAEPGAWFTYYFWLDDARAPDYARTVDIHRKPGYDPVELFLDPAIRFPKAKIAATLLKRKVGGRALLDVIPLDAMLVKGSHGLPPASPEVGPLLISDRPGLSETIEATAVHRLLRDAVVS